MSTCFIRDRSLDRKRPRSELDAELFVDHPTLYMDDGNVILECGKTLFRVHRTVLSKHSPVFRELLAPERDHNTLRGCTFVQLDDDKAGMEVVLESLYGGPQNVRPTPTAALALEKFPVISSALRLAHKYQLVLLKRVIMARLRADWPGALSTHLSQRRRPLAPGTNNAPPAAGRTEPAESQTVHPASVIALLRSIDHTGTDPVLFPALFYDLMRRTPQLDKTGNNAHPLAALAPADVARLVVGGARVRCAQFELCAPPVLGAVPAHAATCHPHATRFWLGTAMPLLVATSEPELVSSPVEGWEAVKDILVGTTPSPLGALVCRVCREEMLRHVVRQQAALWGMLAACFDLR